jgi:hypothetical protein
VLRQNGRCQQGEDHSTRLTHCPSVCTICGDNGKRQWTQTGMLLGARVLTSSELAWEPIATSSVTFCSKRQPYKHVQAVVRSEAGIHLETNACWDGKLHPSAAPIATRHTTRRIGFCGLCRNAGTQANDATDQPPRQTALPCHRFHYQHLLLHRKQQGALFRQKWCHL